MSRDGHFKVSVEVVKRIDETRWSTAYIRNVEYTNMQKQDKKSNKWSQKDRETNILINGNKVKITTCTPSELNCGHMCSGKIVSSINFE